MFRIKEEVILCGLELNTSSKRTINFKLKLGKDQKLVIQCIVLWLFIAMLKRIRTIHESQKKVLNPLMKIIIYVKFDTPMLSLMFSIQVEVGVID